MDPKSHFVIYIAVAAFIFVHEHSDARPTMDSLYGDHVYSGAIYPISGAVPKKIHSHEKSNRHQKSSNSTSTATKEMKAQSNAHPTMDSPYGNAHPTMDSLYGAARSSMDSLYGDHVYSGTMYPISGDSHQKSNPQQKSSNNTATTGNAHPTMDSLYGDHVYSGAIYPISGAVPKKIHKHAQSNNNKTKEGTKAKKAKRIFDKLGIDLSQIDLSQLDAKHKFDGKDSLQPSLCDDTYNDRYGVGKHFVRGARDVAFAIVNGAEGLIDDLLADIPLLPNVTSGIGGGLKAIICAIEDGFSDIAGDVDSGLDIAKNGLVDFFRLKGPHPVLEIPEGIGGIAGEAVTAAGQLVGDAVGGVKNAVGEILDVL